MKFLKRCCSAIAPTLLGAHDTKSLDNWEPVNGKTNDLASLLAVVLASKALLLESFVSTSSPDEEASSCYGD